MEAARKHEITVAVTAAPIDIDRVGSLRAFRTLRDAPSLMTEIGVVGVAEALLDAATDLLGAEAVTGILGDSPRVSELVVACRAVADRLAPEMERLLATLDELTKTVSED